MSNLEREVSPWPSKEDTENQPMEKVVEIRESWEGLWTGETGKPESLQIKAYGLHIQGTRTEH